MYSSGEEPSSIILAVSPLSTKTMKKRVDGLRTENTTFTFPESEDWTSTRTHSGLDLIIIPTSWLKAELTVRFYRTLRGATSRAGFQTRAADSLCSVLRQWLTFRGSWNGQNLNRASRGPESIFPSSSSAFPRSSSNVLRSEAREPHCIKSYSECPTVLMNVMSRDDLRTYFELLLPHSQPDFEISKDETKDLNL